MTLEKSCKFYENAICILKGGCCDLNCDQTANDKKIQFYDEIDTLTQWWTEKVKKELIRLESES